MSLAQSHNLTPEIIADACGNKKRSGNGFVCTCPCKENHTHGDKSPSFAVYYKQDGKSIGCDCKTGCDRNQINAALDRLGVNPYQKPSAEQPRWNSEPIDIYANREGVTKYTKQKYYKDGKKMFAFKHIDEDGVEQKKAPPERYPFNLPAVCDNHELGLRTYFCEGEKDCKTLENWGLVATTLDTGAKSRWRSSYDEYFKNSPGVYVLHDEDETGIAYANGVCQELKRIGVTNIFWIDLPWLEKNSGQDVTDWRNLGHTEDEFHSIVAAAPLWTKPVRMDEVEPKQAVEQPEEPVKKDNVVSIDRKPLTTDDPTEADFFAVARRWSHLGNISRFVAKYGEALRYVWAKNNWLWYDPERGYFRDANEKVHLLASQEIDEIENAEVKFKWEIPKRKAWHKKCLSTASVKEIINGAASRCAIEEKEFDKQPYLLNCKNGTFDLLQMKLLPHDPKLMLSKSIDPDVKYNVEAGYDCPIWLNFLAQTFNGNQETIQFLQRAMGYSLCADVSEQVAFVLVGEGRNGKGVVTEVLKKMMGSYASKVESKFFAAKQSRSHDESLGQMEGYRMFLVDEWNKDDKLDTARFKTVVTALTLPARNLYINKNYEYQNRAKLWFTCNHIFQIDDATNGPWRRMCIIRFDNNVSDDQVDKTLVARMFATEMEAILNWFIGGFHQWKEHGLQEPESVKMERAQIKEDNSPVSQFVTECLTEGQGSYKSSYLHEIYTRWCVKNGFKAKNPVHFGRDLKSVWKDHKSVRKTYIYEHMAINAEWVIPAQGDDYSE